MTVNPALSAVVASLQAEFGPKMGVRPTPDGLVVDTGLTWSDGDRVVFYVTARKDGYFDLEDDGLTIPQASACGADILTTEAEPNQHLLSLLSPHEVTVTDLLVRAGPMTAEAIGRRARALVNAMSDIHHEIPGLKENHGAGGPR